MLKSIHQNNPGEHKRVHNVLYVMGVEDLKHFKSYGTERPANIIEAHTAQSALTLLKEYQGQISSIVMSFRMPDMDGVDFLKEIKRNLDWNYIPTIVITSDINENNLVESVNAGAFYYLEKPFSSGVFSSVLNKALKDYTTYVFYLNKAQNVHIARLVNHGQFAFRTFKEAYEVADWLASLCLGHARDDIVVGFIELLINAIEHGNLEVGYDEKSRIMKEGNYLDRLVERLEDPRFKERFVVVDFKREGTTLRVTITDEGKGFDYKKYMVMDRERMFHPHGKGILMANNLYFKGLEYNERGNSVSVRIELK